MIAERSPGIREFRRARAASVASMLAIALATTTIARSGHADLVSEPPADCVNVDAGAPCILPNGTAGRCARTPDTRRPGRVFITCEPDRQECDRVAVGSPCHGYLGRPAHCREFVDDRTHRPWRACVVDESAYQNTNGADPAPARDANSAPSIPLGSTNTNAPQPAPATPPSTTSPTPVSAGPTAPAGQRRGCSVANVGRARGRTAGDTAVIALVAMGLGWGRRGRSRSRPHRA